MGGTNQETERKTGTHTGVIAEQDGPLRTPASPEHCPEGLLGWSPSPVPGHVGPSTGPLSGGPHQTREAAARPGVREPDARASLEPET